MIQMKFMSSVRTKRTVNVRPEYTTFNSVFVSKGLLRQKAFQAKFYAILYVRNIDSEV